MTFLGQLFGFKRSPRAHVAAKQNAAHDHSRSLQTAALEGNLQQIRSLVSGNPDLVFTADSDGWTALHRAANSGHLAAAEVLIASASDVNAKTTTGWTSLHFAANWGHTEVVALLLTNKADIDAKNSDGRTPLFYAVQKGHGDAANLLVTHGAMVDIEQKESLAVLLAPLSDDEKLLRALRQLTVMDKPMSFEVWRNSNTKITMLADNMSGVNVVRLIRSALKDDAELPPLVSTNELSGFHVTGLERFKKDLGGRFLTGKVGRLRILNDCSNPDAMFKGNSYTDTKVDIHIFRHGYDQFMCIREESKVHHPAEW